MFSLFFHSLDTLLLTFLDTDKTPTRPKLDKMPLFKNAFEGKIGQIFPADGGMAVRRELNYENIPNPPLNYSPVPRKFPRPISVFRGLLV